jgi:hypothetical protein
VLAEEDDAELKQPIGRVDQHRKDVFAVGDRQVDAWVVVGVGSEQERSDLALIGEDETVGEFETSRRATWMPARSMSSRLGPFAGTGRLSDTRPSRSPAHSARRDRA